MEQHDNHILLRGDLLGLPEFSHENHGQRFFRFLLEVPRLSGAVDLLPIVARQELLNGLELSPGIRLTVQGQIRSHNHADSTGRHLMIFVFACTLCHEDGEPMNDAMITGAPGFPACGLSAVHPLGTYRTGDLPVPDQGPDLYSGQTPEPHLYQVSGRLCHRADGLRTLSPHRRSHFRIKERPQSETATVFGHSGRMISGMEAVCLRTRTMHL